LKTTTSQIQHQHIQYRYGLLFKEFAYTLKAALTYWCSLPGVCDIVVVFEAPAAGVTAVIVVVSSLMLVFPVIICVLVVVLGFVLVLGAPVADATVVVAFVEVPVADAIVVIALAEVPALECVALVEDAEAVVLLGFVLLLRAPVADACLVVVLVVDLV